MSIVRVGLSNPKYAAGYDAIFGGKKKKPAKVKKKPQRKSSSKSKK